MVNKLKKLWRWFLSMFASKEVVETVPFNKMLPGTAYLRPSDWKLVSRKGEWERHITAKAKAGVEKEGGTFIKINWNKQKIHYLDKNGRHMTG